MTTKLNHEAYRVAWICPLEVEQMAAMVMLDDSHESLPQPPADHNVYNLGTVNGHNVVIAGLPQTGNAFAATVITQMRMTFPNLRYGLLVGIGGGVPASGPGDPVIHLGHVVVSKPTGIHSGAVQYDHGKAREGYFERTGVLPPPPPILLNAVQALEVNRGMADDDPVWQGIERTKRIRRNADQFVFPGIANDYLYNANYLHQHENASCEQANCSPTERIARLTDDSRDKYVTVHRGTIASGELVVKSSALRDRLAKEHGVLCFEMEAAGALVDFPCLVIRGISDYCDSHKNDRWHGYAAAVAAAYARQLFVHLPKEETQDKPNTNSQSSNFQLPIDLSEIFEIEHFVGRENELSLMREVLRDADRRRTVVLHGMGGMGKTQLAIAYFRRHRTEYSTILWLNLRSEASLKQSFARIASNIAWYDPSNGYIAPAAESGDAERAIIAVKRWLDEPLNDRWLLICDNYDNPASMANTGRRQNKSHDSRDINEHPQTSDQDNGDISLIDLSQYLPVTDHGTIIVTSRLPVKLGKRIQLGKMSEKNDGLEIISSTSGNINIDQDPAAMDLVTRLDGLPLAFSSAGAYMEQLSMNCSEYLTLYHDSWLDLQQNTPELPSYDQTLYTTWNISYDNIRRQSPNAARLLQQWAYFSNEDLWYELLKAGVYNDAPEWLSEITQRELHFNEIMRLLCNHGIVEANPAAIHQQQKSRGYNVHGCVHSWMIHVLNKEFDEEMAQNAVYSVARCVPYVKDPDSGPKYRRLLPHGDRCLQVKKEFIFKDPPPALVRLGNLFSHHGRLKDAEVMYQQALDGSKTLGSDHILTLEMLYHLGILYLRQRRLQDAEKALQKVLHSAKILGPHHDLILAVTGTLGGVYSERGQPQAAEAKFREALDGYIKTLGPDDISTLRTIADIGSTYLYRGQLQEAEAKFRDALDGCMKTLGPDHQFTHITMCHIGFIYQARGQLQDAEDIYQQALDGSMKALGPDHISTLSIINSLGTIYESRGQLQEAETMYQQSLAGYEKAIGPDLMSSFIPALASLENLADVYKSLGRVEEALSHYQTALSRAENIWGRDSKGYQRIAKKVTQLSSPSPTENVGNSIKNCWMWVKTRLQGI